MPTDRRRARRAALGGRRPVAGLIAPNEFQAILNIHFRIDADPGPAGFIGLIGGTAEWVFVKQGHVSVTISAANRMVDQPAEAIAAAVWPDVRAALSLPASMPPWRVVKERRATFAATAAQERLRPARAPTWPTSCWPATGPPPGCRPPSKVPSGPAEPRPRRSSPPEDHRCRARPCHARDRARRTPRRGGGARGVGPDAPAARRRALAVRAGSRCHHPRRIRAAGALPRPHRAGAGSEDRRLSARDPGRARRLAAVPRRRVRPLRQREGVFRAEGHRRRPGRAAHGPRARGDPGGRRCRAHQRLHPRAARAVRPGAVARGAGDAAGDHAPAAVVPVPSVEGVVLVAHRDRAAAGADGAAAGRTQSARHRHPGAVPHAARAGARLDPRAVSFRLGPLLQGRGLRAARRAARRSPSAAGRARSPRRCASSPSG